MTRTALLVADAFYPLTLAGAHRSSKLAKFLPRHGWNVVVLCPEWTEANAAGCLDRALERDVRAAEICAVPSPGLSSGVVQRVRRRAEGALWPYLAPLSVPAAMLNRAREVFRRRRVDVLWSTYNPGYPHAVASLLSRATNTPWVADFRDLPDQSYHGFRERRLALAERVVCSGASALTVTTPVLAEKLRRRHSQPIRVIENGFDPDDYAGDVTGPTEHFTISYFGILYAYRDPRPLFAGLDRLAAEGSVDLERVRVRFFGTAPTEVEALAKGFACSRIVSAEPRVGREGMTRAQRQSTVLLNLQSAEAGGAVPSKLMEYLGANRAILNIPGDGGPIDAVVAATRTGATATNAAEIASVLGGWYASWARDGRLTLDRSIVEIERLTRGHQAAEFAQLFSELAHERHP